MKLLIGGASSKFFHLKEFGEALTKFGIEYKLVQDTDVYTGFPSRNVSRWFEGTKKFDELVAEFKPDAVFVDRQTHFGLAAIKAEIPLFMLLRGDYWSEMKWAKETLYRYPLKRMVLKWKDRIAKQCFEGATAILPICKYLEDRVKEQYPEKKTEILYQGIDPSKWYPVKNMELKHPCVGLLQSAWIWGKTREMLTLAKVLEEMPEVTFYWAGDGPYRDKILETLGKFENFKWLGLLEYPDKVREYISGIDVYALVSGIDMSPLTLQEAQLMEKPVVATRAGGIPELMSNEKTGFLVEKGDQKGWTDRLSALLNDREKSKAMGVEGRKYVAENFSWDKIAKKFVSVLDTYIKK
ncbi:MAG TPA: glycosyltransferase family 4 protein [Candidatus Bathyarchaeia archaeon]|nr:glycosyltransferase family 4 protein [Candidatus Bathyarchaeia archaeon]